MKCSHWRSPRSRGAFTLVELIVVLAIVGVLMALIMPAVQRVRETANRLSCGNNLRQLAIAAHHYEQTHHSLPAGSVGPILPDNTFPVGWFDPTYGNTVPWGHFGWPTILLPFMDEEPLYRRISFDVPAYAESLPVQVGVDRGPVGNRINMTAANNMPRTFVCPSVRRVKPASQFKDYGINFGTGKFYPERTPYGCDGVAWVNSRLRVSEITDGTSTTFHFLETSHGSGHATIPPGLGTNQFFWVDSNSQGYVTCADPDGTPSPPNSTTFSHRGAQGEHRGGVQTVMVDGRLVWIPNEIDYKTYRAMFSRAGGEVVPADF
jgi:prepilin-type N-terminal cleavage/methylation domain-containing protein